MTLDQLLEIIEKLCKELSKEPVLSERYLTLSKELKAYQKLYQELDKVQIEWSVSEEKIELEKERLKVESELEREKIAAQSKIDQARIDSEEKVSIDKNRVAEGDSKLRFYVSCGTLLLGFAGMCFMTIWSTEFPIYDKVAPKVLSMIKPKIM